MAQTFVTGGSGFVGRALLRRLARDGHDVRALVRSDNSAEAVSALGAHPVRADLTEPATWREAVIGSEVLFHLAAETDLDADRAQHERITVGGTRAALDAALHAGVPRFVHCGSEAALLAGDALIEVDETAPLRPDSDGAYCAAKAQSEKLVFDANSPALETVSIRPRFVWGPQSNLIGGLVEAVRLGKFAWIDGGHVVTDVTYVDNAVEGFILGWHRGRPGQAYFVTDQDRVDLRDFLETLFAVYGVDSPTTDLDLATANDVVPVPARWFLSQTCTLRTDRAVNDLGYSPVVERDEGLQAVRLWLAEETPGSDTPPPPTVSGPINAIAAPGAAAPRR